MKSRKLAVGMAVIALVAVPSGALAAGPEYQPEKPHPAHPAHPTPGPNAPMPEKAKAYGVYCRGFSKKHVAGQKGTPFSQCVNAMAKAATTRKTARQACDGMSKEHVNGQQGTLFSRCVVAAAQVKKQTA
jgi:hypothetical protein